MVGSGLTHVGGVIDTQKDGVGTGNSDNDWSDDVDQRQPTGNLSVPNTASTALLAAFQPWAEPYITNNYIATTANGSATYRVVDSINPAVLSAADFYPSGAAAKGFIQRARPSPTRSWVPQSAIPTRLLSIQLTTFQSPVSLPNPGSFHRALQIPSRCRPTIPGSFRCHPTF